MKKQSIIVVCVILIITSLSLPALADKVSASSRIEIGTVLYNADGSEFGKVLAVEGSDRVLVDFGGDAKPVWINRQFITRTKFVDTTDPTQQQHNTNTSSGCCGCFSGIIPIFFTGVIWLAGIFFRGYIYN